MFRPPDIFRIFLDVARHVYGEDFFAFNLGNPQRSLATSLFFINHSLCQKVFQSASFISVWNQINEIISLEHSPIWTVVCFAPLKTFSSSLCSLHPFSSIIRNLHQTLRNCQNIDDAGASARNSNACTAIRWWWWLNNHYKIIISVMSNDWDVSHVGETCSVICLTNIHFVNDQPPATSRFTYNLVVLHLFPFYLC